MPIMGSPSSRGSRWAPPGTTLPTDVCYITDVEGNWEYFLACIEESDALVLRSIARDGVADIELIDGWHFVYGGDVCDKGGAVGGTVRVVKSLIKLKKKYPDAVTLLLGNRDINKLRLTSELAQSQLTTAALKDIPGPYWVPAEKRVSPAMYLRKKLAKAKGIDLEMVTDADLTEANTLPARIRWMLLESMGADGEFERRAAELEHIAGRKLSDDEVADNFVESMYPGGFMRQFISLGQLAYINGNTLFIHGGIIGMYREDETPIGELAKPMDCYGYVPGQEGRLDDVHAWVRELNRWFLSELQDWNTRPDWDESSPAAYAAGRRGAHLLMDYVVSNSLPSVVVGRHLDSKGMPAHLSPSICRSLNAGGITRLVLGHTPHGNAPTIIKSGTSKGRLTAEGGAVETIMCDTSYSDMSKPDNRGSAVSAVSLLADRTTRVHGVLQDGRRISYHLEPGVGPPAELVGLEEPVKPPPPAADGTTPDQQRYFVKAALASGELLMCHVSGFKVLYDTVAHDVAAHRVEAPIGPSLHPRVAWESAAETAATRVPPPPPKGRARDGPDFRRTLELLETQAAQLEEECRELTNALITSRAASRVRFAQERRERDVAAFDAEARSHRKEEGVHASRLAPPAKPSSAGTNGEAELPSHSAHGEDSAMQSGRAHLLRSVLTQYYKKHAPEALEKIEGVIARVVGGPPSSVGGVFVGGVLWTEKALFEKLEAKYGAPVEFDAF